VTFEIVNFHMASFSIFIFSNKSPVDSSEGIVHIDCFQAGTKFAPKMPSLLS
jgi:hypothetical protein